MFRTIYLLLLASVLVIFAACGDTTENEDSTDAGETSSTLTIAGSYTDAFGGEHTLTNDSYTQVYAGSAPMTFNIESVDNDDKFFVAQNDADNEYNPGQFSRFDWVFVADALYVCQAIYDAADAAAAEGTARPDDSDPGVSGCGGAYPWTALTAAE